jgi:hypothetical protein
MIQPRDKLGQPSRIKKAQLAGYFEGGIEAAGWEDTIVINIIKNISRLCCEIYVSTVVLFQTQLQYFDKR